MKFLLISLMVLVTHGVYCVEAECDEDCENTTLTTTKAKELNYLGKIIVKFPMDVVIKQGDKNEYYITGDEASIKQLKVKVHGGVLSFMQKTLQVGPVHIGHMTAYITVKDITNFSSEGRVSVELQNLAGRTLYMACQGRTIIRGHLMLENFSGSFSGYTDAQLRGKTKFQEVDIDGSGVYDASAFMTEEMHLDVQGSVTATIQVSQKLHATSAGSSSVIYSGNPPVTEITATGTSSIKKA